MNLITRILAVDVPENTKLDSSELSFRGLTVGWLIVLLLIVFLGALAVAFFYFLEKGTLGWFRRFLLIGLRCSLLVLLLFLILRPIFLVEFVGQRPQGVALLIDNSESMGEKSRDRRLTYVDKARVAIAMNLLPPGSPVHTKTAALPASAPKDPPRMELVKAVLTHPDLNLAGNLEKFGPLRPYTFGHDLRSLPLTLPSPPGGEGRVRRSDSANFAKSFAPNYKPHESRTALADAIVKVLQSRDSDLPSAIVIITDGQDNASKYTLEEAAAECAALKVPLHIYGVGSSEGGQLQLKEVGAASGTLFTEDSVTIPLRWRAQGFKKGTAEITLTLGGTEVAKKEFNLQTGEDLRDELGFVVPKDHDKRETRDLVATIKYRSEGATFQDKLTRTMRVVDAKIRILYIEHSPRWEFKFLQPAFINRFKKRCDVDFILVNAAPEVAGSGPPYLAEFFKTREKFLEAKYNLIILGDVAASYLNKDQQAWIREFVENRGGLIVIAGRQHMPHTYEETSPIAQMLPIEITKVPPGTYATRLAEAAEKSTQEYPPTLTEAGQRTDWLALADTPQESADVWQKKLMGFHWNCPVAKLRPAATALVVNPRAKMGDMPMPVLATHPFGKGRVLWLGTDETWRWRWNYQDKYFDRFWGQLIYQMGSPSLLGDGAERTQIALNRSQAVVGTQSTLHVTLLDKEFNPRKDPKVDAELEHVDGPGQKLPVTLNLISGGRGEYTALISHQRAGRFELRVKNPDAHTFSFRVDLPPKHELEESGLAEKALRDAANSSGGRFYREEDLHELAGSIELRTKEFRHRQEMLLWNPLAILLFLALITAEWLVRKSSDLS
jgi:hypothetical protein